MYKDKGVLYTIDCLFVHQAATRTHPALLCEVVVTVEGADVSPSIFLKVRRIDLFYHNCAGARRSGPVYARYFQVVHGKAVLADFKLKSSVLVPYLSVLSATGSGVSW